MTIDDIMATKTRVKVALKPRWMSYGIDINFPDDFTIRDAMEVVEAEGFVVEEIAIKASPRWLAVGAARWNAKKKKRQHNTGEDSIA